MLTLPPSVRIYLAAQAVDLRCGHDGLFAIVKNRWRMDPFAGQAWFAPLWSHWTRPQDKRSMEVERALAGRGKALRAESGAEGREARIFVEPEIVQLS